MKYQIACLNTAKKYQGEHITNITGRNIIGVGIWCMKLGIEYNHSFSFDER
jgi:hypothetical protein